MAAELDRDEIRRFYKSALGVSPTAEGWAGDAKFLDFLQGAFRGKFRRDQLVILRLFVRCAHQVSEQEFLEALIDGEIPPVKLTSSELELLKGGQILSELWKSLRICEDEPFVRKI